MFAVNDQGLSPMDEAKNLNHREMVALFERTSCTSLLHLFHTLSLITQKCLWKKQTLAVKSGMRFLVLLFSFVLGIGKFFLVTFAACGSISFIFLAHTPHRPARRPDGVGCVNVFAVV